MHTVQSKLLLVLLIFSFLQINLWAKEKKNQKKQVQKFVADYEEYDDLADDDVAKETEWQILEWEEKDPKFVFNYDVTIERLNPKTNVFEHVNTLTTKGKETSIQVQPYLMPGIYRYKVTTYDLFGFPSVESDWCDFNIYQAFYPDIKTSNIDLTLSDTMYLDEYNDGLFNITGKNLFDLCEGPNDINYTEYFLVPVGKRGRLIPEVLEHDDKNTKLKFKFALSDLDTGTYHFVARDASGLESKRDAGNLIKIKYKKAVDFDVSGGYSLPVLVYDSLLPEYLTNNPDAKMMAFPFSANVKANLMFSKHTWGYLGLGAYGIYSFNYTPTEKYDITGNFIRGYANLVYQKPFFAAIKGDERNKKHVATLEVRVGGGVNYINDLVFHYELVDGEAYNQILYGLDLGASGQWYISSRLFLEGSLDLALSFGKDIAVYEIIPSVSVGWQF